MHAQLSTSLNAHLGHAPYAGLYERLSLYLIIADHPASIYSLLLYFLPAYHIRASESMAKKSSLIKVLKKNLSKEEAHFFAMYPEILQQHAAICTIADYDDEARSIQTFSTNATADDNPGTGRVLDTYFYQPVGRRIERLAMRITIRYLHPWRVCTFIETTFSGYGWPPYKSPSLTMALDNILIVNIGSTVIAGLKGLVQQTR